MRRTVSVKRMGHDSHWSPRLGMSQRPPHPIFIAALYTELRGDKNRSVNYPVTVSEADSVKIFLISGMRGHPGGRADGVRSRNLSVPNAARYQFRYCSIKKIESVLFLAPVYIARIPIVANYRRCWFICRCIQTL